jgi:CDP-4-dehydro-6-deoxyglucose reductase/ferredoxin-NAD(P)+ reductase (naphthalene dioxygenase ferredoxin-specific)
MNQLPPDTHPFRVLAIDALDRDIRILRIAPADGGRFGFAAGQYVRLHLAEGLQRDYSIASAPGDDGLADALEFHIRISGGAGSRFIAEQLAVGDTIGVEGPLGTAFWRSRHTGLALLVAGGSGLAPMLAIAEAATDGRHDEDIVLYAGVREPADLYCADRLAAIAAANPRFRQVLLLSTGDPPDARWRAGLPGEAIRADFTDLAGAKAFLAGPAAMIAHTVPILLALGIAAEDIHSDGYDN